MMKNITFKALLILGMFLSFVSCEGDLDITPQNVEKEVPPKFNFLVRQIDSFEGDGPEDFDTIQAEVYIKQLDFQAPEEKYFLTVSFPGNLDGEVLYEGENFRSGDVIEVPYSELKENIIIVNILPREVKSGNYMLNVSCHDREENTKTATLSLLIPNYEQAGGMEGGSPSPKFNFLVRELSSSAEGLEAEIYIKQLDFQAPEEEYLITVSFPPNLDGEIHYNDEIFRSGDWIKIPYSELKENVAMLNIVPIKASKGSYSINMVCQDRKSNTKSAVVPFTIP